MNELTAIEISIQRLHKQMYLFQHNQFIHLHRRSHNKIQTCISSVHKFIFPLFNNIAHFGLAGEYVGGNIAQYALLLRVGVAREEFRETDFALSGHEHDEIPSACGSRRGAFGFGESVVIEVGHWDEGIAGTGGRGRWLWIEAAEAGKK